MVVTYNNVAFEMLYNKQKAKLVELTTLPISQLEVDAGRLRAPLFVAIIANRGRSPLKKMCVVPVRDDVR